MVPGVIVSALLGDFLETHISRFHFSYTDWNTLAVGPTIWVLISPPSDSNICIDILAFNILIRVHLGKGGNHS